MIGAAVFFEEFREAISGVMGMGEAKVDVEGPSVFCGLTFVQEVKHLFSVPGAAFGGGSATFGGISSDGELAICGFIAVPQLTGSHGAVPCAIEDGGDGELFKLRWAEGAFAGADGQVPQRTAAHDHVSGRRADSADEGTHVAGVVKNHSACGEGIEVGGVEWGTGVVAGQGLGGLVINKDQENVWAALLIL